MTPGDLLGPRADRIEIRGLRVLGTHGLLAEEQDRAQPFEIDLDVSADLTAAGRTDAIEQTVDYGEVIQRASSAVTSRRYHLLEALAEDIAQAVLADQRVTTVSVVLRKLRPPVAADLASVGVRITRSRL